MREPDPVYADPRLAPLYDELDPDRRDLDAYVAIAHEVGARTVVDLGCGTGSLAVRLVEQAFDVVGVDPAGESLVMARRKGLADRVRWVHGDATALDGLEVGADLVVMTGNAAQAITEDDDWRRTIAAVRRVLRPGGWFVFETRRVEARHWETWEVPPTDVVLENGTRIVVRRTVTDVSLPLVTFVATTTIDGVDVPSTSVLRFRSGEEVTADLAAEGLEVVEIREAPDRPGKELVVLSRLRQLT